MDLELFVGLGVLADLPRHVHHALDHGLRVLARGLLLHLGERLALVGELFGVPLLRRNELVFQLVQPDFERRYLLGLVRHRLSRLGELVLLLLNHILELRDFLRRPPPGIQVSLLLLHLLQRRLFLGPV